MNLRLALHESFQWRGASLELTLQLIDNYSYSRKSQKSPVRALHERKVNRQTSPKTRQRTRQRIQ